MGTPVLSDEVWDALDPSAARLSASDRRRTAVLLLVAACLTVLATIGASAGFFRPRVEPDGNASLEIHPASRSFDATVGLRNSGPLDEHFIVVGLADPALQLIAPDTQRGVRVIHAHQSVTLRLHVVVRDCARAGDGPVTVGLTFDRLWWHLTRHFELIEFGERGTVAQACGR